jgi:hypothetical protein
MLGPHAVIKPTTKAPKTTRFMAGILVSSWAVLEDQITIVKETTSHENERRDRYPLHVGARESRDFCSRPLAQATPQKLAKTLENPSEKAPKSSLVPSERTKPQGGAEAGSFCGFEHERPPSTQEKGAGSLSPPCLAQAFGGWLEPSGDCRSASPSSC